MNVTVVPQLEKGRSEERLAEKSARLAFHAVLLLSTLLFAGALASGQVSDPGANGSGASGASGSYGLPDTSIYGQNIYGQNSAGDQSGNQADQRDRLRRIPKAPTGNAGTEGNSSIDADIAADPEDAASAASSFMTERIIDIFEQRPELISPVKKSIEKKLTAAGMTDRVDELEQDSTDDGFFRQIEQDPDLRIMVVQELRIRGYGDSDATDGSGSVSSTNRLRTSMQRQRLQGMHRPAAIDGDDASADQTQRTIRRPSPYPTLPSLRDLYEQVPGAETKLKRFGSDIFKYGTGNTDQLPMDLPAGPEYVLGPGDELMINMSGSVSRRFPRAVDRQGQIALPEAGTIAVAGMTIARAQELIQKELATQYRNVSVEISLSRIRTVRVYVVGDVQRPGAYDISSLSSPLNALYAAGGPTSRGSLRIVRQYRGKELVREIDLYDFMLRGIRSDDGHLQSGDTIMVPTVGPQVAVTGMVRRPAIYELKNEKELGQVLDLAGGVLVSATMRQIRVERIQAHEARTTLSVRLPDGGDTAAMAKALGSFEVQDGDRVIVQPILPYAEKTVYLQGHVFRPGKYSYHDGETVNDLLRSYQDLMPEPADHAEIIRLQPPDFRPITIPFKLSDILVGDDPIELKPFDVVRVYSRYEIDPPKVYVYGQVLRPGEYPLAQGMTTAGLVEMAGGFNRSAYRQEADLSSYVVKDGQRVLIEHKVIDIGKALGGDKQADLKLKPGDVVTIRQLTGWSDIGGAVTVKGEVLYAGKYGIQEGERLSQVLKRAGGFRTTAYPSGAVLERVQVREMAEKSRQELVRRIQAESTNIKTGGNTTGQEALAFAQARQAQEQQVLASLKANPASGRLVIKISSDISKWENTPADIEMRAGDVLVIPKKPNFVLVNGQVYNPAAISFVPGKTAEWYLKQSGGPTQLANKKAVFIVRADGSVLGRSSGGFWGGSPLNARMQPGDSVVVPDKIIGGSVMWKNLLTVAQLASSAAVTASIASNF
jgi:protein involved in polysaccharide export with SLBB domain